MMQPRHYKWHSGQCRWQRDQQREARVEWDHETMELRFTFTGLDPLSLPLLESEAFVTRLGKLYSRFVAGSLAESDQLRWSAVGRFLEDASALLCDPVFIPTFPGIQVTSLLIAFLEAQRLTAAELGKVRYNLYRLRWQLAARLTEGSEAERELKDVLRAGHMRTWLEALAKKEFDAAISPAEQEKDVLELVYGRQGEEGLFELAGVEERYYHLLAWLVGQWLYLRYDLWHTACVLGRLRSLDLWPLRLVRRWSPRLADALGWCLPAHLLFLLVVIWFLGGPLLGAFWSRCALLRLPWWSEGAVWGSWGLLTWTLLSGLLVDVRPFRHLLPRMSLALVVGYVALISSEEIIKVAFQLYEGCPWQLLAVNGGVLLAALLVLYAEASRFVGNKTWRLHCQALRRAAAVVAVGLSRSLVLGWAIVGVLGATLVDQVVASGAEWASLAGPLGPVYPQLVALLAPLALFVGIFVQTVWEDKPITYPL